MADLSVVMSPQGVTGLPRYGGYVFDEWMRELQGPRGRRVFREMGDNDPLIGAILFTLEMLIRQVEWRMAPAEETAEGEGTGTAEDPRVEFIEDCLDDMGQPWQDTISEILSFLQYGFSVHEPLYKIRDGVHSKFNDRQIGWHSWPMRGQETLQRWGFDDMGQVSSFIQLGPPDFVLHEIPMERLLLFRASTKRGNPEGRSILRSAFTSYFFKKKIQTLEGIGIERDLAGIPVAKVPGEVLTGDTPDDVAMREAVTNVVQNIKRDEQEGITWPLVYDEQGNELFKLELLTTGGQRQFDTDKIIQRYDLRILQSVMADFIALGHGQHGTQSLGETKGALFTTALESWLETICSVVNDQAIPQLLRLNGMPTDNMPRLEHGEIERTDLGALGNLILQLANAGFQLDTRFDGDLLKHILKEAHLPEPPQDAPPFLHEPYYTSEQPTDGPPPPASSPSTTTTPAPSGT